VREFLRHRARRYGYDGWAAQAKASGAIMPWSVCTSRDELRQLMREKRGWFPSGVRLVKVRITVEPVT
jgi:hypothetical protein